MVQQGRLVAAALSDPAAVDPETSALRRDSAFALLWRLQRRTTARIRVLDPDRELLADSALMGPRRTGDPTLERDEPGSPRSSLLYRLGVTADRVLGSLRPASSGRGTRREDWESVVRGAEQLGYGAGVRANEEGRGVLLGSALPIRPVTPPSAAGVDLRALAAQDSAPVVGVVLVTQSTAQILRDLDEARLQVARGVTASVIAALLLNLLLGLTIVQPLRRLRTEAEGLLDARGRLVGSFQRSSRADEIGDLRRTLAGLAGRLQQQQEAADAFAADASHEIRNPLAGIQSAAEVLAVAEGAEERHHFLGLIRGNVARAEHLLSSLRELATIDAGLEEERLLLGGATDAAKIPTCDLVELSRQIVAERQKAGQAIDFASSVEETSIRGRAERLEQVIDNLLDNALSFSPAGEPVSLTIEVSDVEGARPAAILRVIDSGPGLPSEDLETVFRRFYSYRPQQEPGSGSEHAGLGLAIVRSITEAYGGQALARNGAEGGAVFECRLPLQS